jgi:uncharacterized protein (DUF983 family)
VKVIFVCPNCEYPAQAPLDHSEDWRCPQCAETRRFEGSASTLPACAVCGCPELYKKKDFPHGLGLSVLILAFAASAVTYFLYMPWATWSILIGTAVFDGALYLLVGDAIVCYRCQAHHKGFTAAQRHQPFEITIGERYRQQRLRNEQVKR